MKISTAWLTEWLGRTMSDINISEYIERSGIEVEQILCSTSLDETIIVGLVKKVIQHPNADRLKVCTVQIKDAELEIVCGAPNVRRGLIVAVAQIGSSLPDGTVIKSAELRGIRSHGMLCSAHELGVSEDHDGILELSEGLEIGTPVGRVLSSDTIIDVKTAANRGDLQSIRGIAREVAAQAHTTLVEPTIKVIPTVDEPVQLSASVEAKEAVDRYLLRAFKVDQTHGTSQAAKDRLIASGVRPISLIVDVTNYVLMELGQPLHAFDLDKVKLPITVRFARTGEKLVTLDGVIRTLHLSDLVIADETGPIALAGVMGGQSTEVTPATKHVLIESATFRGPIIRKTALRHGLRTEASARFERGIPVELPAEGMARVADILAVASGATALSDIVDIGRTASPEVIISITSEHVSQLIGAKVALGDIKKALSRLGFETEGSGSSLAVRAPWWRPDIRLPEDLVEEVVRDMGYDLVPETLPTWRPESFERDTDWPLRWNIKAILKAQKLFEVATYSFVSAELLRHVGLVAESHLKLKNPLSSEQAYLRSSLLPSLVQTASTNRHYSKSFGLFEISKVYHPTKRGQLPTEPLMVAVLVKRTAAGYQAAKQIADALILQLGVSALFTAADMKSFLPSHSAQIFCGQTHLGAIGELHPDIARQFKLDGSIGYVELDISALQKSQVKKSYQELSKFPGLTRDLAVIIDKAVSWNEVAKLLAETEGIQVRYLSDYVGEGIADGKKSLSLRLDLTAQDHTLTDGEADLLEAGVLKQLEAKFAATRR